MNPNIYFYIVACSLCSHLSFAQPDAMTRVEYIEKHKLITVGEMERSGVCASVLLAHAMLRSMSATDELATSANNHFHLLCTDDWLGTTYHIKDSTRQFVQIKCYKKYRSVEAAYADYVRILTENERTFRSLGNPRLDYKYWASVVQKKEALNRPDYTKQLTQLIKKYKLHQYDKMTVADLGTDNLLIAYQTDDDLPPKHSEREIITINRLPAIQTQVDDTPLAIARYCDIPLKKLLQYNDLQTSKFRTLEQNVFLRPKRRKRCDVDIHVVKPNETMYNIAQVYGIRLNTLYKINRMKSDKEPIAGQKIHLCKQRKTAPTQMEAKPRLPLPQWRLITPINRGKAPLRRPQVPRVNDGTEIISPQFIRIDIYSESSLY